MYCLVSTKSQKSKVVMISPLPLGSLSPTGMVVNPSPLGSISPTSKVAQLMKLQTAVDEKSKVESRHHQPLTTPVALNQNHGGRVDENRPKVKSQKCHDQHRTSWFAFPHNHDGAVDETRPKVKSQKVVMISPLPLGSLSPTGMVVNPSRLGSISPQARWRS